MPTDDSAQLAEIEDKCRATHNADHCGPGCWVFEAETLLPATIAIARRFEERAEKEAVFYQNCYADLVLRTKERDAARSATEYAQMRFREQQERLFKAESDLARLRELLTRWLNGPGSGEWISLNELEAQTKAALAGSGQGERSASDEADNDADRGSATAPAKPAKADCVDCQAIEVLRDLGYQTRDCDKHGKPPAPEPAKAEPCHKEVLMLADARSVIRAYHAALHRGEYEERPNDCPDWPCDTANYTVPICADCPSCKGA